MRLDRAQQLGAGSRRLADAGLIDHTVQGIEQEHRREAGIVDRPGILASASGKQFAQMVDQDVARKSFLRCGGCRHEGEMMQPGRVEITGGACRRPGRQLAVPILLPSSFDRIQSSLPLTCT